jgi:hypothetical protein
MKNLIVSLIIIAPMFWDTCKINDRPGGLLSSPVYTIAIGRWYKDQPPYFKIRRSKKSRTRRQSQMGVPVFNSPLCLLKLTA